MQPVVMRQPIYAEQRPGEVNDDGQGEETSDDWVDVVIQSGADVLTSMRVARGTPAEEIITNVAEVLGVPVDQTRNAPTFVLALLDKGYYFLPGMTVSEPLRLGVQAWKIGG